MLIALIGTGLIAGGDGNTVTVGPFDSTAVKFLLIAVAHYGGTSPIPVIADSRGNAWSGLSRQAISNTNIQLYYSIPASVGPGHTITATGAGMSPALAVCAFGGAGTILFEAENGATASGVTALQPGSVTPDEDGCLIVTALCSSQTIAPTLGGGWAYQSIGMLGGTCQSIGLGFHIQTTAAASNPTWIWSAADTAAAAVAVFRPAAAISLSANASYHSRRRRTG